LAGAWPILSDETGWLAVFLGLALIGAGAGEWRHPGGWRRALGEIDSSPALRLLAGMLALAIGAALYLSAPWRSGGWLELVLALCAAIAIVEGLLLLAAGDRFTAIATRLLDRTGAAMPAVALSAGALLLLAGIAHP